MDMLKIFENWVLRRIFGTEKGQKLAQKTCMSCAHSTQTYIVRKD
jgi:hypothetical protein